MRASGTFGQPNPYGGYLGLTLPLALGVVIAGGPVWRREGRAEHRTGGAIWVMAAAATMLMGLALVMTWSRGAWLGFAAAAALMSLARGRKWVARLLLAGLILVSLLVALDLVHLLPGSVLERVGDVGAYLEVSDLSSVEVTDENWAVIERLAHWQAAIKMLDAYPVTGIGIGNYALAYPDYAIGRWKDPLGHAHNYYLHVGAEAGLVGMVAYLVLVGAWLRHAWRAATRTRGYWQGVALGALGVLTHLTVHNMFDNLYVHGMYVQVGMVLGLLAVAVRGWRASGSPATESVGEGGRRLDSAST
jgi:putative inorganic carbon (HCO3(-)) transporter